MKTIALAMYAYLPDGTFGRPRIGGGQRCTTQPCSPRHAGYVVQSIMGATLNRRAASAGASYDSGLLSRYNRGHYPPARRVAAAIVSTIVSNILAPSTQRPIESGG